MGEGGCGGSVVLEVSGLLEFTVKEVGFSGVTVGFSGVTGGSDSGRENGLVVMLLSEGLWAGLCGLGRGEQLESMRGLTREAVMLCGPSEGSCSSPTGGPRSDGVD
ncbi:hypothetical protein FCV25MIE_22096 [Fagus crenata]